ncbi:MAG: methionine--tRNA ligase subunit beta [Candidatus Pacebacteria bacterium]|nr:methionine--tRNA ligase subunit beta [Candidatus Paceibacterota bacterium]
MINYDEFSKVDLRTGKILEAERVEGSDKLIKMKVDFGSAEIDEPKIRQIIAGIGKAYEPENLIGRQAIFVVNLEPRSLMGLESQGMILAATNEDGLPVILMPEKEVGTGSKIK